MFELLRVGGFQDKLAPETVEVACRFKGCEGTRVLSQYRHTSYPLFLFSIVTDPFKILVVKLSPSG